jgi:hypothetical protein
MLQDSPEIISHYMEKIIVMPVVGPYYNKNKQIIYLSHAGYNPNIRKCPDFLWDRTHYYKDTWTGKDCEYVVHGHTPYQFLLEEIGEEDTKLENGVLTYCQGHKFDIDNMTIMTSETCLFNLDTLEGTIIN